MVTGNKIQTATDFIDPTQLRNAHPKHRSIQFDSDGLSFSILDLERNTYIGVRDYRFDPTDRPAEIWNNYQELRQQDEWLKQDFHSASCAWNAGVSTLIPDALSSVESERKLRDLVQPLLATDQLEKDEIAAIEARNVYTIPQNVQTQLKANALVHGSTPFLEGMLRIHQNDATARVLVNFEERHFSIVVLKDRKLQLFNRFPFQTAEDYIYYLLFTMEQLSLNPEEVPVTLYGGIEKNSALYDITYTYVRHVHWGLRPDGFVYAPILDDLPAHQYFALFQQYLCVS
jgi:hypothetical protein